MIASFKGVQFHVENISQKLEFRHQNYEFITDAQPTTVIYGKAPQEYQIEGFLLGKGALLTKDLLLKACGEPKAGTLFHPLYGFRTAVCTALKIEELYHNRCSYRVTLTCREVADETPKSLADKAISLAERAHNFIDTYVIKLVGYLETIRKSAYALHRLAQAVRKIEGLISSPNGLGIVRNTAIQGKHDLDTITALLAHPEKFVAQIRESFDLSPRPSLFHDFTANLNQHPCIVKLATLAVLAHIAKGTMTEEVIETAEALLPHTHDSDDFSILWDISLEQPPCNKSPSEHEKAPSLVSSWRIYGDLTHAEELARAATQPFLA